MSRPRRPIPPYIRNLVPSSIKVGMHDITWEDTTYTMPLTLAQNLADYFRDHYRQAVSVMQWYQQLSEAQQQQILIHKAERK